MVKFRFNWLLFLVLLVLPHQGMANNYVFAAIEGNPYQKAMGQLLRDAFADIGHNLIVTALPGKRALVMSNAGYLDGEVARVATTRDTSPNLVQVPIAIGHFKATAITYKAPHHYTDFTQFKPYTLGILRGIVWSEKRTANYQRMQVNNYNEMIRMLRANRFDYGFGDEAIFSHIKKTTNAAFTILEPPIFEFELYPFLHKSHADLVPQLVEALTHIDETEGLEKRVARYFHDELQQYLKN